MRGPREVGKDATYRKFTGFGTEAPTHLRAVDQLLRCPPVILPPATHAFMYHSVWAGPGDSLLTEYILTDRTQ